MFPSTLRRRHLKTQQSPVILHLCLSKAWADEHHHYRTVIVLEKLRFQNVLRRDEKPVFSNPSGLKSVLEKLRFRDGSVWTVGLTGEISKAAFSNSSDLVWMEPEKLNVM